MYTAMDTDECTEYCGFAPCAAASRQSWLALLCGGWGRPALDQTMYAEQPAGAPGRVGYCAQCMKLPLFWDGTSGGGVGVERL